MALKKQCSWHGCKELVVFNVSYCVVHQAAWEQRERERYKEYDKRRNKDKDRVKHKSLYSSAGWDAVRSYVIQLRYGIDVLEYYRTGRVVQGERVHHIACLEDDWSRRLDTDNLIYLTESNHRQVHIEYDKGIKEKKKMQNILFKVIKRFKSEYELQE